MILGNIHIIKYVFFLAISSNFGFKISNNKKCHYKQNKNIFVENFK
jgi:hypothetical protein